MRRVGAAAVLALVLLSGCAGRTPRPEGVVERWLTSLNQGASGEPHAWADDEPTAAVAPEWDTRPPGAYDEILVGVAGADGEVPFRVTDGDGRELGGTATVGVRDTGDDETWVVTAVTLADPPPALDGSWAAGTDRAGWLVAVALAALVGGAALLVVRLTRPRDTAT